MAPCSLSYRSLFGEGNVQTTVDGEVNEGGNLYESSGEEDGRFQEDEKIELHSDTQLVASDRFSLISKPYNSSRRIDKAFEDAQKKISQLRSEALLTKNNKRPRKFQHQMDPEDTIIRKLGLLRLRKTLDQQKLSENRAKKEKLEAEAKQQGAQRKDRIIKYHTKVRDIRSRPPSGPLLANVNKYKDELSLSKSKDAEKSHRWYVERLKQQKIIQEKWVASLPVLDRKVKATLEVPSMPPLSKEEKALYEQGMHGGGDNEIVAKLFSVDLARKKLRCLSSREWLNDEVINLYLQLLGAFSSENSGSASVAYPDAAGCYFHSTYFYSKLFEHEQYNYANVRRWTQRGPGKCDIFAQRRVFIPHNIHNTHWALCVVEVPEKRVTYYDSMSGRGSQCMENVLRYLRDEAKDKKNIQLDISQWKSVSKGSSVPQQNNGYDCGVFLCTFAHYVALGREMNFSCEDMPRHRKRICVDILHGRLSVGGAPSQD